MSSFRNLLLNLSLIPRTWSDVENPLHLLWDYLGLMRHDYVVRLRNGVRVKVRKGTTDKGIVKEVFLLNHYGYCRPWLQPGAVVFDVGAQIGVFSLYAASRSPEIQVHSFEPMSDNFRMLEANRDLNSFSNIHPHRQAVADKSGDCRLFLSEDNTGMHSLHRPGKRFETVPGVGINDLFDTIQADNCDVMKLDCEGAETGILRAASDATLKRIRCLVMEYHDVAVLPEMKLILEASGMTVQQSERNELLYAHRN